MDELQQPQDAQAIWDAVAAEREQPTAPSAPPVVVTPEAVPEPAAVASEPEPKSDPLADVLARLEKMEGRQRNVEGHIGGLTSEQRALKTRMETAQAASAVVGDAPTQSQLDKAADNPQSWQKLKADFPEWADATESFLNSRLQGLQAPAADLQAFDGRMQRQLAQQRQEMVNEMLDTVLDNWQEQVRSEPFGQWLTAQPADVQALAQSDRVADAARMLRLFDDSRRNNPAQKILEDRSRKLAQAVTPQQSARAPAQKSVDQMTPQELWDYEARQRARSRAQSI